MWLTSPARLWMPSNSLGASGHIISCAVAYRENRLPYYLIDFTLSNTIHLCRHGGKCSGWLKSLQK